MTRTAKPQDAGVGRGTISHRNSSLFTLKTVGLGLTDCVSLRRDSRKIEKREKRSQKHTSTKKVKIHTKLKRTRAIKTHTHTSSRRQTKLLLRKCTSSVTTPRACSMYLRISSFSRAFFFLFTQIHFFPERGTKLSLSPLSHPTQNGIGKRVRLWRRPKLRQRHDWEKHLESVASARWDAELHFGR